MEDDANEVHKSYPLITALIVLESLVIFAMAIAAAYLAIEIKFPKVAETVTGVVSSTAPTKCSGNQKGATADATYKLEGEENITVDGKKISMCCGSVEQSGTRSKVCSNQSNSYVVTYSLIGGKYILASEMYPKEGKSCIKSYQGTKGTEICL